MRIGSAKIHEEVLRRQIDIDSSGCTVVRYYHGPSGDLLAAVPAVGLEWADMPHKPTVEKIVIKFPAPDTAEMTVTGRKDFAGADGVETTDDSTYEVDFGQLEKPLLAHPRYSTKDEFGITASDELGTEKITVAGAVEAWRNESSIDGKKEIRDRLEKLSTNAANMFSDIVKKLGKGIESYIIPAPILRITTISSERPTTTAVGKVTVPTGFPAVPAGYTWLVTADRAIRQGRAGKWERVREWTGAAGWDSDIYK